MVILIEKQTNYEKEKALEFLQLQTELDLKKKQFIEQTDYVVKMEKENFDQSVQYNTICNLNCYHPI